MSFNDVIKGKKKTAFIAETQRYYNHPHRLSLVSMSGSVSYIRDGRLFTSPDGKVYTFSADFSVSVPWSRVLDSKTPLVSLAAGEALSDGEFKMLHQPVYPWRIQPNYPAHRPALVVGGTATEEVYSGVPGGGWLLLSTNTVDLKCGFEIFVSGGGLAPSYGRGTGTGPEKTQININPTTDDVAAYSGYFPDLDVEFYRLPWDDPWASESAAFSTAFSDYISASNTTDGGGHSGTCSLSVDFT